MELKYRIYGSAKIGMLSSNQAVLEVFDDSLVLTTYHGKFEFYPSDIVKIHERRFLFGVFKSVKIKHHKKGYHKQLFFHIPPLVGDSYQKLKLVLIASGFNAE